MADHLPFSVRELLESGLRVSVGCTEPAAVALASAHAARAACGGGRPDVDSIEGIEVRAALGVYKNALAVTIPNSGGRRGIRVAAALGASCDPGDGLRVLATATPRDLASALRLVDGGKVKAELLEDPAANRFVDVRVDAAGRTGRAALGGSHDGLVRLERDGAALSSTCTDRDQDDRLPGDVALVDLVRSIEAAAIDDLARINEGLRLNLAVTETGLSERGVGAMLRDIDDSADGTVAASAAAAVDARMRGVPLPVMASCGSGNQGILVHLPIALVAEREGIERERAVRAIALAQLVTQYATDRLGLLSPLCGLFAKGGLGAAAGLCHLLGGDASAVDRAVRLMIESHAGTVCDGAGAGCAAKMVAAVAGAIRSARIALRGFPIENGPKLASSSAERAIDDVATLAAAMTTSDRALFDLLRKEAERDPG